MSSHKILQKSSNNKEMNQNYQNLDTDTYCESAGPVKCLFNSFGVLGISNCTKKIKKFNFL